MSDSTAGQGGTGGLFGALVDTRTYGALLYMILSLATGIFYFTWAITGLALSLGLFILIIGIPFALLFLGSVRIIGWVEARLTGALLGANIPQIEAPASGSIWERIKHLLGDPHTWGTLVYMILQLPLGIIYFTIAVTLTATSLGLMGGGAYELTTGDRFGDHGHIQIDAYPQIEAFLNSPAGLVAAIIVGAVLLLLTLHIARGIGYLHARIAEALLVR
jgi:hypothetical protein